MTRPSIRLLLFSLLCPLLLGASLAHGATWKVTLIAQADAPDLERRRLEQAYLGHPGGSARDGVMLALEDARHALRQARVGVRLDVREVSSAAAAADAARQVQRDGARMLLTQLPADWTLAVADAVKLPVLNLSASDDRLRETDCRPQLFHLLPSERMRADALAQALVQRRWSRVLLLAGPDARDAVRAAAAEAAIQRYGLQRVDRKTFKLSADPRERQLANPLLLTGGKDYDVVWVVDSDGEFARSLPYHTALARPVIGDAGWVALAWHARFERFGAPQVARRFAKAAQRAMTDHDWAAWMGGKAITVAATVGTADPAQLGRALQEAVLDGSKGVNLSFRSWDGQLRQPLLLTDGQGVLTLLPVDGILHPSNVLDTLGADQPQRLCKARRP